MSNGHETLAVSTAIAAALAAVLLAVLAGFGFFSEAPVRAQGSAGMPACSEWTDGCVVCARKPEGLACSMPGIACTRGAVQCLKP